MPELLLTIGNTERRLLDFHCTHLGLAFSKEEYYLDFLRKNFPFDFMDSFNLSPFIKELPPENITEEDLRMAAEARNKSWYFGSSDSGRKDHYYRELTRLRYKAGKDGSIIPNPRSLNDMNPLPKKIEHHYPSKGPIENILDLKFASTDDDTFFYEWIHDCTMEEGVITVYPELRNKSPYKIEFWACYCIHLREHMHYKGLPSVTMHLRLSSGVVRNRGVIYREYGNKTRIDEESFTPRQIAPPVPLVTSVHGEEASFPGGKVAYSVTGYSMLADKEKADQVNWAVSVDGAGMGRIDERGEKIVLEMKKEWEGKEIMVMPYLNTPSERVSVRTRVEKFIIPRILTETDRKAGLDEEGGIARDMHFGKATRVGQEWVFEHTTNSYILNQITDVEIRQAVEKEMLLDDATLFKRFRELVKYTSTGDLQTHNLLLVDKLQGRKVSKPFVLEKDAYLVRVSNDQSRKSEEHTHSILTKAVYEHESTIKFVNIIEELFIEQIRKNEGNINRIDWLNPDSKNRFFQNRPRFSGLKDRIGGLQIALNDTWGHRITLTDYKLDDNKYTSKLLIHIFDHFGLDISDISKFGSKKKILETPGLKAYIIDSVIPTIPIVNPYDMAKDKLIDYLLETAAEGFRAWFILQHCKGYKPFITVMEKELTLEGEF